MGIFDFFKKKIVNKNNLSEELSETITNKDNENKTNNNCNNVREVITSKFDLEDSLISKRSTYLFKYDSKGNKICSIIFNYLLGEIRKNNFSFMKYDNKNNLISEITYSNVGDCSEFGIMGYCNNSYIPNKPLLGTPEYYENDDTFSSSELKKGTDSTYKNIYNHQGQLVEVKEYNNNIIEGSENDYEKESTSKEGIKKYEYDQKGNITSLSHNRINYNGKEIFNSITNYKYDNNGNKIEEKTISKGYFNDYEKEEWLINQFYNSNNEKIKKIEYKNGNLGSITKYNKDKIERWGSDQSKPLETTEITYKDGIKLSEKNTTHYRTIETTYKDGIKLSEKSIYNTEQTDFSVPRDVEGKYIVSIDDYLYEEPKLFSDPFIKSLLKFSGVSD